MLIVVVPQKGFRHTCKKDFDSMSWAFATLATGTRISRRWLFRMFVAKVAKSCTSSVACLPKLAEYWRKLLDISRNNIELKEARVQEKRCLEEISEERLGNRIRGSQDIVVKVPKCVSCL